MEIDEIRDAIPMSAPAPIRRHLQEALTWLEEMEEREEGDPRQILATKHSLMATIEVYKLVAETARRVALDGVRKEAP